MKTIVKVALLLSMLLIIGFGVSLLLKTGNIDVLNPQGEIASRERDLLLFTTALSLVVVVPVFFMLALFSWKFREGNKKAKYTPDWDSNKFLETIWWGIPFAIILVLSVITWNSSHDLDPSKPIVSEVQPITIQVVALQWKWLFIYPEQQIASVNLVQFPEKTPLNFVITSDAPMNSFWIPSLGGQIYAMSGMSTKLHLIADTTGDFKGSSANISGQGFADMKFIARSSSTTDFDAWVKKVRTTSSSLDIDSYEELAKPGVQSAPSFYALSNTDLYDTIVMKYMTSMSHTEGVE